MYKKKLSITFYKNSRWKRKIFFDSTGKINDLAFVTKYVTQTSTFSLALMKKYWFKFNEQGE